MSAKTTDTAAGHRSGKPTNKWRRRFLISAGIVGGALVVGTWRFYRQRDRLSAPDSLKKGDGQAILTSWIKIDADGNVIVQVPRQEMGQGVTTALPILVAEELNADLEKVRFEQAEIDPFYANATLIGDGVPRRPDDSGWLATMMRITQFKLGQTLGMQATGGRCGAGDAGASRSKPIRCARAGMQRCKRDRRTRSNRQTRVFWRACNGCSAITSAAECRSERPRTVHFARRIAETA